MSLFPSFSILFKNKLLSFKNKDYFLSIIGWCNFFLQEKTNLYLSISSVHFNVNKDKNSHYE